MMLRLCAAIAAVFLCSCGTAGAQQANPLDIIPDKMPFSEPYGAPISLARAEAAMRRRPKRRNAAGRSMSRSSIQGPIL